MVVVVIIATGATICLKAYNTLKTNSPTLLEDALFSIQQQAGVMAALCATVFAVITALRSAKMAGLPSFTAATVPQFGTKTAGTTVPATT